MKIILKMGHPGGGDGSGWEWMERNERMGMGGSGWEWLTGITEKTEKAVIEIGSGRKKRDAMHHAKGTNVA